MKSWFKNLFPIKTHPSLITIFISKNALLHNLHHYQKMAPEGQVAPVLKSNAYGHGLIKIAEILKDQKIPFYVIDSYFEARAIRNTRIKTPLLIIGYTPVETIKKNYLKEIKFTITSLDQLKELKEKINKKTAIHLKIDTGMHRQGILPEEIDEAITLLRQNQNIFLEGVCSHFGDADNQADSSFTFSQISEWNDIVKKMRNIFPETKYFHISNTHGHSYSKDIDANLTRLGIGLYLTPTPVLKMETVISGIKNIKKGESVGYGNTFIAKENMKIATIPVGYFEGIERRLSNKGFVKIENQFAPIIGRVSMNITTIDVSKFQNIKRGDKVTVISNIPSDPNSIENMAKECDMIPYEIAVYVPMHLRRIVVE